MFFSNNYITRDEVQEMFNNLMNENTILKEKISQLENNISQQNNIINHQSMQIKDKTNEIYKLQNACNSIKQSTCNKQAELFSEVNLCTSRINNLDEVQKDVQQQIYNLFDILTVNSNKINNFEKSLFSVVNSQEETNEQLTTLKDKFNKTNIENFTIVAIDNFGNPIFKDNFYMDGSYLSNEQKQHIATHLLPMFMVEDKSKKIKKICLEAFKNMKIFELGYFNNPEIYFYTDSSDTCFSIIFTDDDNNLNDKLVFKTHEPFRDYKLSKTSLKKLLNFCIKYKIKITYIGKEEYNGKSICDLILS